MFGREGARKEDKGMMEWEGGRTNPQFTSSLIWVSVFAAESHFRSKNSVWCNSSFRSPPSLTPSPYYPFSPPLWSRTPLRLRGLGLDLDLERRRQTPDVGYHVDERRRRTSADDSWNSWWKSPRWFLCQVRSTGELFGGRKIPCMRLWTPRCTWTCTGGALKLI